MNFLIKAAKTLFEYIQIILLLAIPGGIFLVFKKVHKTIFITIIFFTLFSLPAWLELWNSPKGFAFSLAIIPLILLTNLKLLVKHKKNLSGSFHRSLLMLSSYLGILSAIFFACFFYQRLIWGYQLYHIPTNSMSPALLPGDYVLVNTRAYRKSNVEKEDIIVFKMLNNNSFHYLIKRVIFLQGDRFQNRLLKKNELAVMGDNRGDSEDSRIFGAIDKKSVVGKAMWIVFSVDNKDTFTATRIGIDLNK